MVQNDFFYVAKSEFWSYYLNSRNAKYLLKENVEKKMRGELFNEYVTVVNIETSAFCNRKCSYCPVAYHPKREQAFMENSLFSKILNELKEIDFRGIFTLSLFNEPLADRDILQRLIDIKKACPNSYIRMNSNGDYLDKDLLEDLNSSGLDEILITQHMNPDENYEDIVAESKLKKFFERVGVDYQISTKRSCHNVTCDLKYKKIRLLVVTNNWEIDGNDRGGEIEALSNVERTQPCCTPFREFIVDVEGNVRFCWNLYVNTTPIGNLKEKSILDIYFSDKMTKVRREHLLFGKKNKPCSTCNMDDYAKKETVDRRKHLLRCL